MDSFVKCHYCKKNLSNPLELNCRHSYCQDCLTKEVQNDKVICPVCGNEHIASASSLSSAKQDKLAPYIIGLHSGEPYAVITDDSPPVTPATECVSCKKVTDLRKCFHCDKPLCADCRTKHYEGQKKDVDQSVDSLTKKSTELSVLAKELNTSRSARIQEYKTMKEQIAAHVKDITKKIHDEEQDLQKKIDARIQLETEKIAVTEREQKHLEQNKAALAEVADKYRQTDNQMVLLKMHKDYLEAAPVWKTKLDTHAGRLNVKKEEELHYHPTSYTSDDSLVGKLSDSKNVTVHAPTSAKRMAARHDQSESRACSIM